MKPDIAAHQAAVLAAHARYSNARRLLLEIEKAREQAENEYDSAKAELDVLATRAP
jgi:hypothetical protein